MYGSSLGAIALLRYLLIRTLASSKDRAPFPSPNAAQARLKGNGRNRVKKPPPTMKFLGACEEKHLTGLKSFETRGR